MPHIPCKSTLSTICMKERKSLDAFGASMWTSMKESPIGLSGYCVALQGERDRICSGHSSNISLTTCTVIAVDSRPILLAADCKSVEVKVDDPRFLDIRFSFPPAVDSVFNTAKLCTCDTHFLSSPVTMFSAYWLFHPPPLLAASEAFLLCILSSNLLDKLEWSEVMVWGREWGR